MPMPHSVDGDVHVKERIVTSSRCSCACVFVRGIFGCLLLLAISGAGYGANDDDADRYDALAPQAKVVVLADFNSTTGTHPQGGVILASDGNFYGVTTQGGRFDHGTAYRMKPSGSLTVIHDFTGGPSDGVAPQGLVQGSDGALYGISYDPGVVAHMGFIFRLTLDGAVEVLHILTIDDGVPFLAPIQASDGYMYGVTGEVFQGGAGELYRISHEGDFKVVAPFGFGGLYSSRYGQPLEGDDGNFYVTASAGGSHHCGGLLRITPTGDMTTLYEFRCSKSDGRSPQFQLAYDAAHEYMYGVTTFTVPGVFRYRDGAVETVALFKKDPGPLTLGPDGMQFYLIDAGNLYSISPEGEKLKVAELPGPRQHHRKSNQEAQRDKPSLDQDRLRLRTQPVNSSSARDSQNYATD